MSSVWEKVKSLDGKTLHTLARHKPFVVESVLYDRIEYRPINGSGAIRWSWRIDVEKLVDTRCREGKLFRTRVDEEFPNEYNSSYMTAVVDAVFRLDE